MKTGCLVMFIYVIGTYLCAFFFCRIEPWETYSWYSGVWHGFFWFPNIVMSLFSDSIHIRATDASFGYYIAFGMGVFINIITGQVIQKISNKLIGS